METDNNIDNTTDDVLIEVNENEGELNQKGVKRVAQTPPEKEAKKPKLSRESSPSSIVELSDNSPVKDSATDTPRTPKTPKTPKVSREEREKLKKERMEEREKQKAERERLLEEKRLEKEKLAEEKRLEKEKKEKERLEKKLEEDRKKEEKRKEAELKKKKEEEEKQKKEDERLKKEEERLKKEEEKNKKKKEEEEKKEAKRKEEEAAEEKKRRESNRFMSFFAKIEKKKAPVEPQSACFYLPFQLKDGMTLAPILVRDPLPEDCNLLEQKEEVNSIATFINSAKKWKPLDPEESEKLEMKTKIFQFHENRRPPWIGTFRKKSSVVKGWCPLKQIEGVDYEVDSNDEWEDEPSDGEECNSDDDAEKDNDEEDDEDDGFFVPPCYLSDGEGEEETTSDGESGDLKAEKKKKAKRVTIDSDGEDDGNVDETSNDAAERKARLEQRAQEWAKRTEKKKQLSVLPRAVGPIYVAEMMPVEFKFMAGVHFY